MPYSLVVICCWGLVFVFLGLKPVGVMVPRYWPVTLTGFFLVLCHLDFSL